MRLEIDRAFRSVEVAPYEAITKVENDCILQMQDGRIVLMNAVAFHIFSHLNNPETDCLTEYDILQTLRESFTTDNLSDEKLISDIHNSIIQLINGGIIILSPVREES